MLSLSRMVTANLDIIVIFSQIIDGIILSSKKDQGILNVVAKWY